MAHRRGLRRHLSGGAHLEHGHVYRGAGELLSVEVHDHENFDRPAVIIAPEKMRELVERDVSKLVQRRIPFREHISYDENITPFLDALEKLNEKMPLDGALRRLVQIKLDALGGAPA